MISRYTRPEMGALWDEAHVYATWLEVELAAAEAMAARGTVPSEAMEQLRAAVPPEPETVAEIEAKTRHDVIAFLEAIERQVGPAARWLHLGLTSSDVLDTSLALRCVRSLDLILEGWDGLVAATEEQARRHRDLPCIGRSHGIHAEPMTFGLKILGWHQELVRARERLARAREVVRFGQISGAVGTYNTVEPEVEAEALESLGLEVEPVSTQIVPRDRHAEMLSHLAVAAAAIERIATEIRGLQRTEVREVEEPFGAGQKGSSVMPHKRNPIKCENLVGLSRLVRAYAGTGLENIALWHERDISHSSVERVAVADALILVDFMTHRVRRVVEGMHVYPDNMKRNLEQTRGLVFSSRVLPALMEAGVIRSEAYVMVQRAAMRCWDSGEHLRDVLAADDEVMEHLGEEGLAACFDLDEVLRHVDTIFARALGPGRDATSGAAVPEVAVPESAAPGSAAPASAAPGDSTAASGEREGER